MHIHSQSLLHQIFKKDINNKVMFKIVCEDGQNCIHRLLMTKYMAGFIWIINLTHRVTAPSTDLAYLCQYLKTVNIFPQEYHVINIKLFALLLL
jgi:hypothetical protein